MRVTIPHITYPCTISYQFSFQCLVVGYIKYQQHQHSKKIKINKNINTYYAHSHTKQYKLNSLVYFWADVRLCASSVGV